MKLALKSLVSLVLVLALVVGGCSTAWIQTAIADIPVVLQIATSIISIVQTAKGTEDAAVVDQANAAAALAKQDLQTLQQLVNDYQAASAADKPNLVGKIDAALVVAQNDLSSILNVVHVKNQNLQLTVATSVGLALSTLAAIQTLIPAPVAPGPATAKTRLAQKPPSPKQLKAEFNAVVRAHGYAAHAIQ